MKTLTEYLREKQTKRIITRNVDGIGIIYKYMSDAEKAILKSHQESIVPVRRGDLKNCRKIKERYCLSWDEILYIINRLAR